LEVVVLTCDWVIIELSDLVDNPSFCEIENAITSIFGDDTDYFIPIYHEKMGSYTSTSVLMQGYIFVKDCEVVRSALVNVKDHRLFQGALVYGGKIQTVPSGIISGLRRKLKNSLKKRFTVGKKVKICDGALKNLIGEVVGVEDDGLSIMVKVNRISREILAPIPATLIEEIK
jgi:transcription antitermination factor NusG